jgi:hypothetical protein
MISVSENFLVESEWCFFQNKICLFLAQGICIYVGHSFHISRRDLRKRTSWKIIGLYYVPLISIKDEELDLPSLYWILKLHKCLFKQRYITGSAKCSTKPFFQIINMYSISGQNRASNLL